MKTYRSGLKHSLHKLKTNLRCHAEMKEQKAEGSARSRQLQAEKDARIRELQADLDAAKGQNNKVYSHQT